MLRCRRCKLEKINAQVYNLLQHLEELDLGDNQVNCVGRVCVYVCAAPCENDSHDDDEYVDEWGVLVHQHLSILASARRRRPIIC